MSKIISAAAKLTSKVQKRSNKRNTRFIGALNTTQRDIEKTLNVVRGWIEKPASGVVRRMDSRTRKATHRVDSIAAKIPRPLDRYR